MTTSWIDEKFWHVAGKVGIKLEATQLVLRATEKPMEVDALGDALL